MAAMPTFIAPEPMRAAWPKKVPADLAKQIAQSLTYAKALGTLPQQ